MKRFLFFFLLTTVFLTGCRDNSSFIDSAVMRRLRHRNQPELVAQDFARAMQKGSVSSLFALSTDAVESKLCNELALSSPNADMTDLLEKYSKFLKKKYIDTTADVKELSGKPDSEDIREFLLTFRKKDKTETQITLRLIRNKSGDWKNMTRL